MKVLIADDHSLIREGVKLILNRLLKTVEIMEADDFDGAQKIVAENMNLDLIVMDLFMPGSTGPKSISVIRDSAPTIPIVVLSMSEDVKHIQESLKFGANGYIPKSSSNSVMSNAINLVLEGSLYIPPEMLDIITHIKHKKTILTPRQTEVLALLAEGRTNKEIARTLAISDTTVKSHMTTLFRQLGAENRTQAVHFALQNQLILSD